MVRLKRARIIYNPSAGREQFRSELPYVLEQLEQAGYEASAHATTGEGDATREAKLVAERKYDLLIIAGGDGTINEVVSGIAEASYRPRIGIIPAGTTNDFARALFMPKDTKEAIKVILEENERALDIGKVNGKYFINIAGGGDLTELTFDVSTKMKATLGRLAYYVKGIEMLPSIRSSSVTIEYDGEVFEGDIMLFLVANTNSVSGFDQLAPDALLDDGYFDMIILKKTNLADFVRLVTAALRGIHLKDEKIIYTQAKRIKVTPHKKMLLNLDGEYGGEFPGEIVNLPQHLTFLVSKQFIEREQKVKKRLNK